MLIPGRSAKQGTSLNKGKLKDEYKKITSILEVNSDDMVRLGLDTGDQVKLSNEVGETIVSVKGMREGKLPVGCAFIPYGPPSSCLMSGETCGTGMPESKHLMVQIELVKKVEKEVKKVEPAN